MAMADDIKKTIKDFEIFVASFAQDAITKHYRDGFALHLYYTNGKHMSNTARILDECLQQSESNYVSNLNVIKGNLKRILEKVSSLKRAIDRNWHLIEDLLLKPVHVPVSSSKKKRKMPESTLIVDNVGETLLNLKRTLNVNWNNNKIQNFLLQPLKPPVTEKRQLLSSTTSITSSSVDTVITGPRTQDECYLPQVAQQLSDGLSQVTEKQLKTDCEKCSKRRTFYVMAISELKVKLRSSRKTLRDMSKIYNVRVVNQNMKRKDAAIDKLKRERKAFKIENLNLKSEVNRLKTIAGEENVAVPIIDKQEKSKAEGYLSQTNLDIEIITKEILTKEDKIQELKLEVNILKQELTKLQEQCSIEKLETALGNPDLGPKFKRIRSKQNKSHKQKCDDSILDIASCSEKDIKNITDIPANVAIEIEELTYITVLDKGSLELWNHKVEDSRQGPTKPADIFTTIKIDSSKVAFKSVNGKYWSLQTDGRVVSIAETIGSREQFEPVFKEGKMALIGHNNCFLSYNEDGDIVCESCTADPKMWFKLRSNVARMKDPVEVDTVDDEISRNEFNRQPN